MMESEDASIDLWVSMKTIDAIEKCPACSMLALRYEYHSDRYGYYHCNSCGWKSSSSTMRMYVRATLGTRLADPGVLYLMELLLATSDLDDTPPTSRVSSGGKHGWQRG